MGGTSWTESLESPNSYSRVVLEELLLRTSITIIKHLELSLVMAILTTTLNIRAIWVNLGCRGEGLDFSRVGR